MKPVLIFINPEQEKIQLTTTELNDLIEKVYNAGYDDGYKSCMFNLYHPMRDNWYYPYEYQYNGPDVTCTTNAASATKTSQIKY